MKKARIDCECGFKGDVEIDDWMISMMYVWCPSCKVKLNLIPLKEMEIVK